MVIEKNQIFNLMDTNGRRSDVLNALKVYLEILEELKEIYPTETWSTYPDSIAQFVFYEKALEKSRDVFKTHKHYDRFMEDLGTQYPAFLSKNADWITANFLKMERVLDEAIEKRARHYTSNLVKIGFTTATRSITEAGYSYLRNTVNRDAIEELLPLDNINIALLRQLSKLRIFSTPDADGNRSFYSPFLMALTLLLDGENVDRDTFEIIVQGLSPYSNDELKAAVCGGSISIDDLEFSIQSRTVTVPPDLIGQTDIGFDLFKAYFKSSKNNDTTSKTYYDFFVALKNFREDRCISTYDALLACFDANSTMLQKAFGYGKAVFQIGNRGNRYDLNTFLDKNAEHPLLTADDYLSAFYVTFTNSKWIDGIKEYSDTTIRLLSATGLFKFKNLPELSYRDILSLIFDVESIRESVFGVMTKEEYIHYEDSPNCYFGKSNSITEILQYSPADAAAIVDKIGKHLGVSTSQDVKASLQDKKSADFLQHISEKYPKEKIMEILPLFSDRKNDLIIRREVNDTASIPTIYEYIIGIAWYYISDQKFDLYNSLNLTLDADFEPVLHAAGGDGDIVIDYGDIVVMLEVTLMNKQAQKRGEWEPVLRHSLNLKAANAPKETITFFIANEYDYNTVNIWRAVAAVSLESTNTHQSVNGVVIMPFTNHEILEFLDMNVPHTKIIEKVKESFAEVPQITNVKWHDEILSNLIS